ncbi:MAG: hypothetical protein KAR01_08520, partial [Desulfocapsa sp.]|nr:hypothetical protein [Desulfocapsa sp.]
ERLSLADSVESASCRYPVREKNSIENDALTLLGRIPQCGKQQGLEQTFDESEQMDISSGYPEQLVEKDEQESLFAALFGRVVKGKEEGQVSPKFSAILANGLTLQPEERLLLKLLYQDDISVKRAGGLLGLNRDQVNGRLRRLLSRLRKELQDMGLEEELLEHLR